MQNRNDLQKYTNQQKVDKRESQSTSAVAPSFGFLHLSNRDSVNDCDRVQTHTARNIKITSTCIFKHAEFLDWFPKYNTPDSLGLSDRKTLDREGQSFKMRHHDLWLCAFSWSYPIPGHECTTSSTHRHRDYPNASIRSQDKRRFDSNCLVWTSQEKCYCFGTPHAGLNQGIRGLLSRMGHSSRFPHVRRINLIDKIVRCFRAQSWNGKMIVMLWRGLRLALGCCKAVYDDGRTTRKRNIPRNDECVSSKLSILVNHTKLI